MENLNKQNKMNAQTIIIPEFNVEGKKNQYLSQVMEIGCQ